MKILFCTNKLDDIRNGPAKFATHLINYKSDENFEVFILSEDIKIPSSNKIKVKIKIPTFLKYFGQFYRMMKYMIVSKKLDKKHCFDYIIYNHALIGSLHSLFSKKVIGMVNDENNIERRFKEYRMFLFPSKFFIFYFFEMIAVKNMKYVIVNSNYLKNKIENAYNVLNCHVLYKGIEEKLVKSIDENFIQEKEKGTICFIKADYTIGGLDTLLRSLKDLNFEYRLTIVGVPNVDRHRFKNYNVNHINWLERLSQKEVFRLLKKTDIFCLPALSEGFGVANIEAVAMGCKVVSTNVGGVPEALYGYKNVKLIHPKDPKLLADTINASYKSRYIIDKNIIEKLKKSSYSSVFPNFIEILKSF